MNTAIDISYVAATSIAVVYVLIAVAIAARGRNDVWRLPRCVPGRGEAGHPMQRLTGSISRRSRLRSCSRSRPGSRGSAAV